MSLDSLLRATGKNLANCGEKADWYSPISDLTNLVVSTGVVSLPAVSAGSGMALNKNRIFTNGETFTIHANHTTPTGDVPADQYRYIIKPYKNNTVIKDITIDGWTYNQYYNAYWSSGTSKSFTLPKDTVNSFEWGLGFLAYGDISAGTVLTYSNIQIEKGSTATAYEPYEYLGPKTINLGSDSKNLIIYPYSSLSTSYNGITYVVNDDGSIKATGTSTGVSVFFIKSATQELAQVVEKGKQYTFSGYTSGSGGYLRFQNLEYDQQISLDTQNQTKTFTANYSKYYIYISVPEGNTIDATFYPQLEEGTTATDYKLNTGSKEVLKVSYNSKNFFDMNTLYSYTGLTKSITNNTITFTSTEVNGRYVYRVPTEIGKQYTVSVKSYTSVPAEGQTATGSDIFLGSTENPDTADYGTITSSSLTKTFTATAEFLYIKQYICYSSSQLGGQKVIEELQVELGDTKTDYVAYFNTVVWEYKEPTLTGYNITSTINDDGTQTLSIVDATSTTDQYDITSTDNSDGTQTLSITDI